MWRLRALERDPEYVLVYLGDWELVRVLREFWGAWRDGSERERMIRSVREDVAEGEAVETGMVETGNAGSVVPMGKGKLGALLSGCLRMGG